MRYVIFEGAPAREKKKSELDTVYKLAKSVRKQSGRHKEEATKRTEHHGLALLEAGELNRVDVLRARRSLDAHHLGVRLVVAVVLLEALPLRPERDLLLEMETRTTKGS